MANRAAILGLILWALAGGGLLAEESSVESMGTVRGKVILAEKGTAIHHTSVVLVPLGKSAETNEDGVFVIENVPPGTYGVIAHMHALSDERRDVTVEAGREAVVDFELRLSPVREAVTVTATGREVSVAESFQSVTSLEGYQLAAKSAAPGLGDALEFETGIAKRSGGPGSSRPVVRGFDGDRVLVLQDGIRTGTLGATSGDHGEPVDTSTVDRIEVVRGPATLLYGSNAIGGVVNILTGHHILHEHPHEGFHATLNALGGTTNAQGGGSGSFEYGRDHWLLYGAGGGTRTGDYNTPIGRILNSASDMKHAMFGMGKYGEKLSFMGNYGYQEGLYGVPVNPEEEHDEVSMGPLEEGEDHEHGHGPVRLNWRRHNARFGTSVKNLGKAIESVNLTLNYSDWRHTELEGDEIGTVFNNKQFVYRGTLNQQKRGVWTGSFGFWGLHRDFKAVGEEALAPPTTQNSFAAFALEELTFERIRFQFGARYEHTGYDSSELQDRSFNGLSGSVGTYVPLWRNGALVANYMHSFRAPALEELYNNGPHPGNAFFEIGNTGLTAERSNGYEVGLRHLTNKVRVETSFYNYLNSNFVYLRPTGDFDGGLPVGEYLQAGARYVGAEAKADFALARDLWLLTGFDYVDANLRDAGRLNLPRIPPGRGRVGLDWHWKGFMARPEVILTNRQWQVSPNETETAGYALFNVTGGYTTTTKHTMHTVSAHFFNAGNRLYYNHLNFLKAFAPEIGRGLRVGYTLQWF
jgi:iron complex outermembrane receptor protein